MTNQDLIIVVFAATLVFVILAFFAVLFLLIHKKKQKRSFQEKLQLQSQFSQTLLQSQLEIQEQTLKNISQEIHDNIGQALSLAKLNLNTMSLDEPDKLLQKIGNSKELVSKAIVDLRDLSRSLNTDYVEEMGLIRSVEYELEMIRKSGTLQTRLEITGQVYRFDKQKELITFRIVQEVLNNIIKHAKAYNINVHAGYSSGRLELTITDDGQGVDLTPLNENNGDNFGLGIRNMHNRAKLIGAAFSMSSAIGKGTEVKISLPRENNHHNEGRSEN
ncbi:MAG: sensor histidine kinase [Chitinophagaceae bacterium]|nr:sensor histidine kinase [Chitinophagaceae bacterium]